MPLETWLAMGQVPSQHLEYLTPVAWLFSFGHSPFSWFSGSHDSCALRSLIFGLQHVDPPPLFPANKMLVGLSSQKMESYHEEGQEYAS